MPPKISKAKAPATKRAKKPLGEEKVPNEDEADDESTSSAPPKKETKTTTEKKENLLTGSLRRPLSTVRFRHSWAATPPVSHSLHDCAT